jgi:hypothetical protein
MAGDMRRLPPAGWRSPCSTIVYCQKVLWVSTRYITDAKHLHNNENLQPNTTMWLLGFPSTE